MAQSCNSACTASFPMPGSPSIGSLQMAVVPGAEKPFSTRSHTGRIVCFSAPENMGVLGYSSLVCLHDGMINQNAS